MINSDEAWSRSRGKVISLYETGLRGLTRQHCEEGPVTGSSRASITLEEHVREDQRSSRGMIRGTLTQLQDQSNSEIRKSMPDCILSLFYRICPVSCRDTLLDRSTRWVVLDSEDRADTKKGSSHCTRQDNQPYGSSVTGSLLDPLAEKLCLWVAL